MVEKIRTYERFDKINKTIENIDVKECIGISKYKGAEFNKHGVMREVGKIGNQEVFIEEDMYGIGRLYYNTRTKNLVRRANVPNGTYVYKKLPSDKKAKEVRKDINSSLNNNNIVRIK